MPAAPLKGMILMALLVSGCTVALTPEQQAAATLGLAPLGRTDLAGRVALGALQGAGPARRKGVIALEDETLRTVYREALARMAVLSPATGNATLSLDIAVGRQDTGHYVGFSKSASLDVAYTLRQTGLPRPLHRWVDRCETTAAFSLTTSAPARNAAATTVCLQQLTHHLAAALLNLPPLPR